MRCPYVLSCPKKWAAILSYKWVKNHPLCRPQIPTRRYLRFLLNCYPRLVSIPYRINAHNQIKGVGAGLQGSSKSGMILSSVQGCIHSVSLEACPDARATGARIHTLFRRGLANMAQYVYTMNRVGKVVPPKREILKDISLSFFPGAKIGVLGLNGAGKSTLLRIMAGIDQDYIGEARPQPDINVGYLPQEPELDDAKTVK